MGCLIKLSLAICLVILAIGTPSDPSWSGGARGDAPILRPPVLSPVVWSVIAEPVVLVESTDDRIHVAYELLVNNVSSTTVRIDAIETIDPNDEDAVVGVNLVVTPGDEDVTGQVRLYTQPSTADASNYSFDLPPGVGGIVYLDLTFEDEMDVPEEIAHRVTVSRIEVEGAPPITTVGALTEIGQDAVVLSPPLLGDGWVNASGCCTIIGPHRFTVLPINGNLWAAEHFAIDFIQLDEQGFLFTGDPEVLANWHYYGAPVLAAAGGKVIDVVNDLPDQVPGEFPPGANAQNAGGNHVVVQMHNGKFAFYAHLIPGSIVVGPGDVVRRGQLLGQLGNSGNSDGPHLHFHVMNGPSPLESVGLPFVFDRMELQGRLIGSMDEIEDILFAGMSPAIDTIDTGIRRRQMSLTNDLLGFE